MIQPLLEYGLSKSSVRSSKILFTLKIPLSQSVVYNGPSRIEGNSKFSIIKPFGWFRKFRTFLVTAILDK